MSKVAALKVSIQDDKLYPAGTVFAEPFPSFLEFEIKHRPWHVVVREEVPTDNAVKAAPAENKGADGDPGENEVANSPDEKGAPAENEGADSTDEKDDQTKAGAKGGTKAGGPARKG